MKKLILISRNAQGDWTEWRLIYLIKEYSNCWHIWSWQDIFGKYIHKNSLGYKIQSL